MWMSQRWYVYRAVLMWMVLWTGVVPCAYADLLVGSLFTNSVLRYDSRTGAFLGAFVLPSSGGLQAPWAGAFGPDGHLYVASIPSGLVLRYDGRTGAFLDVFTFPVRSDVLRGLAFGLDGHLYVSDSTASQVLRYDGTTGVFLDTFVPHGRGGLDFPFGLTFGPDGHLYVSSQGLLGGSTPGDDSVLRYDSRTGAFLEAFVSRGSGGLDAPSGLVFGPDGHLYVSSLGTDSVLRYDGHTGAFLEAFVSRGSGGLRTPGALVFGPDGHLYVGSVDTDSVLRYDGRTGAFLGAFVTSGSGGLDAPGLLLFTPPDTPPDCITATATPYALWPPDHHFVPISIIGVTDPKGHGVTITATGVFQDEPVKGGGSGNTSPDATLSPLAVRAERGGNPKLPGNGRVYHIHFTADDGHGGACTGTVTVCVPHDQSPGRITCVDDGSLFDSLSK